MTQTRRDAPANPWDRRENETAPAYAAFRAYLEAGAERTLRSVAQELGKSASLISRWSNRHQWVARVEAFEAEAARRADDGALDELEDRARRQAQITQLTIEVLAMPAQEIARRIQAEEENIRTMPLDDLFEMATKASRALPRIVQTERLVRGQSTNNLAGSRGGPLEIEDVNRAEAEKRAAELPEEQLRSFLAGAEAQRQVSENEKRKKGSAK